MVNVTYIDHAYEDGLTTETNHSLSSYLFHTSVQLSVVVFTTTVNDNVLNVLIYWKLHVLSNKSSLISYFIFKLVIHVQPDMKSHLIRVLSFKCTGKIENLCWIVLTNFNLKCDVFFFLFCYISMESKNTFWLYLLGYWPQDSSL